MPVKIRLSRHGRKKAPFYHIVVADSRAPRDGRFIERIGSYNPVTNPATIELNFDSALDWLHKGAQPTETTRAILSYTGVLMKKHLLEGVKKGALTQEQAEEKFQTWLKEKESKIQAKKERIAKGEEDDVSKRMEAEAKVREARAEEIAKRRAAEAKAEAVEEQSAKDEAETEKADEPVAEVKAEAETEKADEPAVEVKAEPEAKKADEPAAEVKAEAETQTEAASPEAPKQDAETESETPKE